MNDRTPDQIDPDLPEQEMAEQQDDAIPTHGYHMLPVVGIGGSAGSIGALHQLLQHTPAGSGLAFVVILHLSPDHESELARMLQKSTAMPVVQVRETMRMQADTVYVIPPRKAMRTVDNQLQLLDLPAERQRHVVVDTFLRALAESHGPHATAVVLSGGDGDGAIGIKRIKERGGLTIAQEPEEAEVSGMPRTAVSTGMVDWVLPIAEIAPRIVEYHRNERALRLPPEAGPQIAQPGRSPPPTRARCARCWASCACAPAATSPTTSAPPSCAASAGACRSTASPSCPTTWPACARARAKPARCCRTS